MILTYLDSSTTLKQNVLARGSKQSEYEELIFLLA